MRGHAATALPDLNQTELSRLERIKAVEAARVAPEADKQRRAPRREQTADLVERGRSRSGGRAIVASNARRYCCPMRLPWDDDDLKGVTAGDVLRDPKQYEGRTMADPH